MGKRYGNVRGNYTIVDRKCIGCKYLQKAERSITGMNIGGFCKAGYCKKYEIKKKIM